MKATDVNDSNSVEFPWPDRVTGAKRCARTTFFSLFGMAFLLEAVFFQFFPAEPMPLSFNRGILILVPPALIFLPIIMWNGAFKRRLWAFVFLKIISTTVLGLVVLNDIGYFIWALSQGNNFHLFPPPIDALLLLSYPDFIIFCLVTSTIAASIGFFTGRAYGWFYAVGINDTWE
ncbi:hypothetical protein [Acidocella sp.]|uniref:hypothetical protein n=1 Tax=Acidocella sp. TaxID=50710 RepID=UPI003D0822E8